MHYSARAPVATKLDRYRDILVSRLGEYPDLTAVRLFEEIKAAGYAGGYTQVKEYVRKVRPRAPEEPVVRFETPPGHQGQVDFADFRLPWGKRYAFLVVLGFSRVLWLQFFTRQTMLHVFEGLEAAFTFFGGVPRELLFDQMKAVVTKDERAAGGRVTENAEFLRFAHHWDFRVRACRPYRAKTKGKVERPVSYVRSTSNKGFEEWGQILGDEVMAAALIDRLLHHCHIVNIRASSYRMRKHIDLSKILHSPPAQPSPLPPKRKRARAKEKSTN